VMDGTVISAMRTGAVSGVAARHLAREGASVLALYGAGVQARTQLAALERTLPALEEIRLFDLDRAKAERLAADHEPVRGRLVVAADARSAAEGADVVVPATMAAEPYITQEWIAPGALVVSISSLDLAVDVIGAADLVVADDWEHETSHASRPLSRAHAEGAVRREDVVPLGAIVAGDHPGRTSDEQRIVVSPVGMAIEDVAEATRVYRGAKEAGVGTWQRLWNEPVWR